MKIKVLLIALLTIILNCPTIYAEELVAISSDDYEHLDSADDVINPTQIYEEPIILDKNEIQHIKIRPDSDEITEENGSFIGNMGNIAKKVYKMQIEDNTIPSSLLEDYLTWHFEKGPVEKLHFWSGYQTNADIDFSKDHTSTKFYQGMINIFFDGEFKGGQEEFRVMLNPTPQSERPYFQPFIKDLYVQSKRIPHHRVLIGNSSTGIGLEGAQSAFTLPLLNRSQISRNLANVRKFGVRVRGDYSLVNYDLGGYSSDTYFSSFFPGAEFDGWVNFKPFGKTNGKYGKLLIGGGLETGKRHDTNFFLTGANISYEYKKFWARAEYANANGSNGNAGLTNKRQNGWYATVGYHLTPKLEIVARYDEFDPDKHIKKNNQREYTAGINYYIKGQALKLVLNYVFCDNDSRPDGHRLLIGTQIAL